MGNCWAVLRKLLTRPFLSTVTTAFLAQKNADIATTLAGFADSLDASDLGTFLGGFVAVQDRDALLGVLTELADVLDRVRSWI